MQNYTDSDFEFKGDAPLYELHTTGLAKSYYSTALYETEIVWEKGARYPVLKSEWDANLSETKFDGISDSKLRSAYDNSNGLIKPSVISWEAKS